MPPNRFQMMANDRVERPATMPMPRPDAAHYGSRSASNALLERTMPALEHCDDIGHRDI